MSTATLQDREQALDRHNPIGVDGIEFIEYTSGDPDAFGALLARFGFREVARHRSRDIRLWRLGAARGGLHIVLNAQPGVLRAQQEAGARPRLSALGLRVRDAAAAWQHALAEGASDVPSHAQAMELNIPAIHGPGGAHLYFVDRWRDFSIFDIDFRPVEGAAAADDAHGLHWFGIVQNIGRGRSADWAAFYKRLLGFSQLPAGQRFGVLPDGAVLASPCGSFYLQLVEPHPTTVLYDDDEYFSRIAFGTPDVPAEVARLKAAGIAFVESGQAHTDARGALTEAAGQGVAFELVAHGRR